MAAPAYRSANSVVGSSAGTSATITKPTGTVEGDHLTAVIERAGATDAITPPSGWSEDLTVNHDGGSTKVFTKLAGGSEPSTYQWTWSTSTRYVGGIVTVNGSGGALVVSAIPALVTNSSTTPDPPASGTLDSGDYLVHAIFGQEGKAGSSTAPTNYTERVDVSTSGGGGATAHCLMGMATRELTSITSENPGTFSSSENDGWAAGTIVIGYSVPIELAGAGDASSDASATLNATLEMAGGGDASSEGSADMEVIVELAGAGDIAADGSGLIDPWTPRQELSLETSGTPESQTGHWISVRGRTNDASNDATLHLRLLEGVTERWSGTIAFTGSTSWSDETFDIPDVDTQAITNYSNLSIEFWAVTNASQFQITEGPALCFLGPLDTAEIILSGDGHASSEGSAQLNATIDAAGTGNASTDGSADITVEVPLQGPGEASSEGSGVLSVTIDLSGSGNSSSDGFGDLEENTFLSGAGDASSEGSGVLNATVEMSGSGNSSSEGTGDLEESTFLSGSGNAASDGDAQLTIIVELSGSGNASTEGSAALSTERGISGDGHASSEGSGILESDVSVVELSGSGQASSDGSGVLNKIANVRPTIVITGTFTATTTLDSPNRLAPVTSGAGRQRRHPKSRLVRLR